MYVNDCRPRSALVKKLFQEVDTRSPSHTPYLLQSVDPAGSASLRSLLLFLYSGEHPVFALRQDLTPPQPASPTRTQGELPVFALRLVVPSPSCSIFFSQARPYLLYPDSSWAPCLRLRQDPVTTSRPAFTSKSLSRWSLVYSSLVLFIFS